MSVMLSHLQYRHGTMHQQIQEAIDIPKAHQTGIICEMMAKYCKRTNNLTVALNNACSNTEKPMNGSLTV